MDKSRIENLIETTGNSVAIAKEMSDRIVNEYTKDLDELMRDINRDVVVPVDVPDVVLQRYYMELTNAYYFISAKCEAVGLYEDISKSNARIKYNDTYGDTQLQATTEGRKMTVAELTVAAEQGSLDETVVAQIYSRSFKIIKAKLEAAQTQINTLGKILNSHDIERKMSGVGTV
jgi:hypothetical protein